MAEIKVEIAVFERRLPVWTIYKLQLRRIATDMTGKNLAYSGTSQNKISPRGIVFDLLRPHAFVI